MSWFSDLLSVHLSNLILLYKSYSRFIQFHKPALVICNDVFYGMYALMKDVCIRQVFHSIAIGL